MADEELARLAGALNRAQPRPEGLDQPIREIARAARKLAKQDDAALRRRTLSQIDSVLFAMKSVPSH